MNKDDFVTQVKQTEEWMQEFKENLMLEFSRARIPFRSVRKNQILVEVDITTLRPIAPVENDVSPIDAARTYVAGLLQELDPPVEPMDSKEEVKERR